MLDEIKTENVYSEYTREQMESVPQYMYRILHDKEGFYRVQRFGRKFRQRPFEWYDVMHDGENIPYNWEEKELAAAYLCGYSQRWIHSLRFYECLQLVVEE